MSSKTSKLIYFALQTPPAKKTQKYNKVGQKTDTVKCIAVNSFSAWKSTRNLIVFVRVHMVSDFLKNGSMFHSSDDHHLPK